MKVRPQLWSLGSLHSLMRAAAAGGVLAIPAIPAIARAADDAPAAKSEPTESAKPDPKPAEASATKPAEPAVAADATLGLPDEEVDAAVAEAVAIEKAEEGKPTATEPVVGAAAEGEELAPIRTPDYAGARAVRAKNPIRDLFRRKPYMQRFLPENGLFEIGMYAGYFMPSPDHDLRIEQLPREEYYWIAGSIGGRFGYFPLSWLGVEMEGFGAGGRTEETGYSAIFYTVRAHFITQLPFWSVTPFILGGAGALGAANETMGHDRDFAAHFGIGVKIPTSQRVSSRIDFRDTLSQKYGEPNGTMTHYPEGHIGVTFVLNRTVPDPPRDQDYDGLHDEIDECPRVGALTVDGCPAMTAVENAALDKDGDGVAEDDECPSEPGPAPSGCPDQDLDKDGFLDVSDQCPREPETKNGFEDENGCPDDLPADLSGALGAIDGIEFEAKSAKLKGPSSAALDARIAILKKYPTVKFALILAVAATGPNEAAKKLAGEREAALGKYFADNGVPQGQLGTRSETPSYAVDANADAVHVSLEITQSSPAGAEP